MMAKNRMADRQRVRTEKHAQADTAKTWRKRLLPLVVCLALVPAPFALAANSGGQDGVPVNAGDYGNDTPSGHTVTIDSDVAEGVYGGYTTGTESAHDNNVMVSAGSIRYNVYGGYANSGDATNNQVTMTGGEVGVQLVAGLTQTGNADGNSITLGGGQVGAFVVAGRAERGTGSANNNYVVISNTQVGTNVIGGQSEGGMANGNTVIINDGSEIGGSVNSGVGESASNNSLIINGGTLKNWVSVGIAGSGNATGNSVIVNGGNLTGGRVSFRAGHSAYGNAENNSITINGGTFELLEIHGGQTTLGNAYNNGIVINGGDLSKVSSVIGGTAVKDAIGNLIVINGGQLNGGGNNIIGGYAENGNAAGNQVIVTGDASVSGAIAGGFVVGTNSTGNATNNTVTLATDAGANLAGTTIYGGLIRAGSGGTGDATTGNTLNVDTGHVEVKNIANFQTVNLNVNANTAPTAGQAMLALNNATGTDLSGTQVNMQGAIAGGGQGQPLATTVTLIRNTNGLTTDANTLSGTATIKQGVSLNHHYTLQADNNTLTATYNNQTTVDPATGVFTNGRLATVGFLNEGTDFALDTGMARAMETIRAQGYGAYGAIRGSDIRHDLDKGGDAEVSGTHWLLGLAGKLNTARDYDLIGSIYAEAGWGNIDSDNSFASGHGDTHYYGIGLIGRYQQNEGTMKGAYAQINAKIGRASTDLESNLYDANGNRGEYDEDSTYYGAGVGVGYLWEITQAYTLDLSARYQWLHLDGYNTDIANDPYKFDDIDSHRTKVGARLNYTENKQYTPYIGVAWEHEFSGSARGSVYGYSLDDNSLKGDTGVAEIGVTFSPTADSAWKIDANLQGYAGQREGVAGNLVVNYLF